jgi:hypothetical protein
MTQRAVEEHYYQRDSLPPQTSDSDTVEPKSKSKTQKQRVATKQWISVRTQLKMQELITRLEDQNGVCPLCEPGKIYHQKLRKAHVSHHFTRYLCNCGILNTSRDTARIHQRTTACRKQQIIHEVCPDQIQRCITIHCAESQAKWTGQDQKNTMKIAPPTPLRPHTPQRPYRRYPPVANFTIPRQDVLNPLQLRFVPIHTTSEMPEQPERSSSSSEAEAESTPAPLPILNHKFNESY